MLQTQISITGGGGHLGTCLIQMLLEQGFSVRSLFRNYKPPINHSSLSWIKGDIVNSEDIDKLILDTSVMIHCASIISIDGKNKKEVYNTNVNGTENIINSCLKKNVKVIYISSSNAVVETKNNAIFNEERPYKRKTDFQYGYTKALSEKLILNAISKADLEGLIIRPTLIIGHPDFRPSLFGNTILDIFNKKIPMIPTGGYNFVDIKDLSQTIINSISLGKNGEIYLIGGEYYSIKEIANYVNPNHRFIHLPIVFLISIYPFLKMYKSLFKLPWPITYESLKTLQNAPKKIDYSKAVKELNHTNRPIQSTINDMIAWFKKEKML